MLYSKDVYYNNRYNGIMIQFILKYSKLMTTNNVNYTE